jgi:hypothetical protein
MVTGQAADSVSGGYVFDNSAEWAGARLRALSEMFDPSTIRHLSERGVYPGWQCWEVGGGNGSIATWLGERVGPTGRVLPLLHRSIVRDAILSSTT